MQKQFARKYLGRQYGVLTYPPRKSVVEQGEQCDVGGGTDRSKQQ